MKMMQRRLKVILPSVNILVATLLLGWANTRPSQEWSPVPWQMVLCFSVNAPANLLRVVISRLWDKTVYPHCSLANADLCLRVGWILENVGFLLAVGLVWWLVGLEIESIGLGRRAIVPKHTPARIAVDVLLISLGALLIFLFVANWRIISVVFAPLPVVEIVFHLAWGFAITIPYGYDLARSITRNRA
jgi:hypothetical protein